MILKRSTGWLGVDVGTACVKTAQAVRRGGRYYIRSAAIVPRTERWTAETLSAAPQESSDEILTAASLCDRLSGRAAASVLPMAICECLQVDAPPTSRRSPAALESLVAAETQQSPEGRVVGAWPAGLQSGKLNVMTAPVAWSDRIAADMMSSRWNCRVIDALPWALARATCMADAPHPLRTLAALDLGYARATMCLIHEGAPAIVRCLKDCGFAHFVAATESGLRMSHKDAALLLHQHGVADAAPRSSHAPNAVDDALVEPLHHLEREARRTLGYWQSQTRGTRPERLYVFGAGATLPGVRTGLIEALDLDDVRLWSLPPERPVDAETLPPAHLLGPALAASALAWEDVWPAA
jgi:Tfp pilus assembly PilM family ATPase